MDKISKIFRKILPIYWAFLTFALLKPAGEQQDFFFIFQGIDKVVHLTMFMLLSFCFISAFPKIKIFIFFNIMLIYAVATEILQDEMQLGRSLESLDLIADTIGIILGYLIYKQLSKNY